MICGILDGVLPREVTYGNIYLNNVGSAASAATYISGAQTLITGDTTLTGTLDMTGTLSAMGNIQGNGAVSIAPGAVLELPYNSACSAAPAMISARSWRRIWWNPANC